MTNKLIGVYLVKGVLDIFDKMEKLSIKKVNRIINDLKSVWANSPKYTEIVQLNKDKVNVNTISDILNSNFVGKYESSDIDEFVKIYRNISGGQVVKDIYNTDSPKNLKPINKKIIKFTDDLWVLLDKINDKISLLLFEVGHNPDIDNRLDIETMDVSNTEYFFDVYYYNGKRGQIRISDFIRAYCNIIDRHQIYEFVRVYNKMIGGSDSEKMNYIDVPKFNYDPKNVRNTFISLVTETYPHGTEKDVFKFLPELETDKYGNLYKIIGKSDTLFTSHLDTASRTKGSVRLVTKEKDGCEFICSDETTILGADDKAGVTVMLYMMANNIPGVYYFFLGEERGGIGSGKVADEFHNFLFLKDIKKCVSFDRRNYYSIITDQAGSECCSADFAESLCKELNKSGLNMNLDPTGVFTDSANFIDYIPECTNISVGYFNEHTHEEIQNITFLEKLAKACVKVDWDKLVIAKKIGFDQAVLDKWGNLITDIRDMPYYNDISIKGNEGRILIEVHFNDDSLKNCYEDLQYLESIFLIHRCDPDIRFDGDLMKILIK